MENSLVIIVLVAVLLIVGGRYLQSRGHSRERKLRYNERGQLVAIEEVLPQKPIHLRGEGNYSTEPIHLDRGMYRIFYQFPDDVLVKVDLIRDGDADTLLLKRGKGVESFAIEVPGHYIIAIAPADEISGWDVEFVHQGQPHGQAN